MRSWALVHDGIVTRVVASDQNPFPAGLRTVEVTGIPAQRGNSVDAVGNVGPSPGMTQVQAVERRKLLLAGESAYRSHLGVWLPANDPTGHLFEAGHGSLAKLSALAAAGSKYSIAAGGEIVELPAPTVLSAIGAYMEACIEHELLLTSAGDDADMTEGWPDNGEPDEKAPAPAATAATRQPGTGIVPEQTPEAPHADPGLVTAGTVESPSVQTGT